MTSDLHIRDCLQPRKWAEPLGLVDMPLFGANRDMPGARQSHVLLDGAVSSFAICPLHGTAGPDDPIRWSWSANLNHTVLFDDESADFRYARWDMPPGQYVEFSAPEDASGIRALFEGIRRMGPPRRSDVVLCVLRAFRSLRDAIPTASPKDAALDAVLAFNALLAGTEAVRVGEMDEDEWLGCRALGEALEAVRSLGCVETLDLDQITASARKMRLNDLLALFVRPDPRSNWRLEPSLLLRHAAGQLYQEANLMIERDVRQLHLFEGSKDRLPEGTLERFVRFTPAVLARSLAEHALDGLSSSALSQGCIEILDPACGCGVFLREALRELEKRGFGGRVILRGIDLSPISCAMARFCLDRARREVASDGLDIHIEIENGDALTCQWGKPLLVLMNPPFIAYKDLSSERKDVCKQVLGDLAVGRYNEAMAFIWRAANSLSRGGTLAAVLPSSLLETDSGKSWRQAIQDSGSLRLLGRLKGYGFFSASVVEPAFLLLDSSEDEATPDRQLTMALAEEGGEDSLIRGLRRWRRDHSVQSGDRWEIVTVDQRELRSGSWAPKSARYARLVADLSAAGVPRVRDLFTVHQGARTGFSDAFILSAEDLSSLPTKEHLCFRPVASTNTINHAQLLRERWVFYPYGEDGLTIATEADLRSRVPEYYRRWLGPNKDALVRRAKVPAETWWQLTWERSWQRGRSPKMVTKGHGQAGGFAYDSKGEFIVTTGHAWLWRNRSDNPPESFHTSALPYAYIALLNSPFFEEMLACFCPQVRGGQFNLARKFVGQVFLPDLTGVGEHLRDVVEDLAEFGRQMTCGKMLELGLLDVLAESVYQVAPRR